MLNLKQIIQLARMIDKFAEIETANGILICNGDLAEGVEVFVEQDGEVVAAPDGEYETEAQVIVIVDGKVSELKDKEEAKPEDEAPVEEAQEEVPAEEPVEEAPVEDEKDAKIAELEAKIAELEAENAELKNKLGEAEEALSKPVKTETKLEKQNKLFKNYLK